MGTDIKLPNFFIIGAPKCGTTSLAAWLSEHPNIYISPWKEPRYFDRDLKTRGRITTEAYRALFAGVGPHHKAIGEATVWYLYSQEAVPAIECELPGSKYIVMVRNPVDMAYALHEQFLLDGVEHIKDFRRAWEMSPLRRAGKGVRRLFVSEPRLLDYQMVCSLGQQVERLYKIVPPERILVIVLDDLKKDARREYLRVLDFLEVPDGGRTELVPRNPAKRVRSFLLQKLIRAGMKAEMVLKSRMGLPPISSEFWWKMNAWNKVPRLRPPLSAELRDELTRYYKEDIRKLEVVLGRDLSHWYKTEGA